MARTCYPSTWEVGEEGLGGQGHLQLHSKFETSLSCVSKQTKDRKKKEGKEGKREVHEIDRQTQG